MNVLNGKGVLALALPAMFAGANLSFQALVNTPLREFVGSHLPANLIRYVGGTVCRIVSVPVRGESLAVLGERGAGANPLPWTGAVYGLLDLAVGV